MKSLSENPLYADVEIAEHCGVSAKTLRNWRALGQGPRYIKLGKRTVRYLRSDVEAFISAGAQAEGGAK